VRARVFMCVRGCHGDSDAAARAAEQQTASRDGGAEPRGAEASVCHGGGVSEDRLANGNFLLLDIATSVANGNVLPCDIITTTTNKQQ